MKVNLVTGGVVVAAIAVMMGVTNPQQENYNDYASEKFIDKAEKLICAQTGYCEKDKTPIFIKNTVKDNLLKPAIASTTTRQNLIIFSNYTTDIPGVGQMKTVGALGNFFTYSES